MRTEDQTIAGIFWAYDGVLGIGGPLRLYNCICDVAVKEALAEGAPELVTAYQLARFYAVLHVTISDATVAVRLYLAAGACYKDIMRRSVSCGMHTTALNLLRNRLRRVR